MRLQRDDTSVEHFDAGADERLAYGLNVVFSRLRPPPAFSVVAVAPFGNSLTTGVNAVPFDSIETGRCLRFKDIPILIANADTVHTGFYNRDVPRVTAVVGRPFADAECATLVEHAIFSLANRFGVAGGEVCELGAGR